MVQFELKYSAYIYSGQALIRDEVSQCLDNRFGIFQACAIGKYIFTEMKEFVEAFVQRMTA